MKDTPRTFKRVFSNWKYIISAIIVAVVFYEINVIIANYNNLVSLTDAKIFTLPQLMLTFSLNLHNLVTFHSFISLIIISLLIGILFALLTYKTKLIKDENKKSGAVTSIAIFLGILAPGCAACGIGILSALGIGAATLAFLPFEGLEISLLSVILLLYAISKISQNINSCKIK